MKLTIAMKLSPSASQAEELLATQKLFAQGCAALARLVVEHRCWNQYSLHHLGYRQVRSEIPQLGSQLVCNAIRKVCGNYKALKIGKDQVVPLVSYRPTASIHYCARTFSLKKETREIFLYTPNGRVQCGFRLGARQLQQLEMGKWKEGELVRKGKEWYFHLVIELPDPTPVQSTKVISVDLGENNLATTSNGTLFGGGQLRHKRDKFLDRRRKLQSNGSRAAKRCLRAISGRESRHVRAVNHLVSKAIVEEAVATGASSIVMEELTNIRKRIRGDKRMRSRLHRWGWRELQQFVEYKALAVGVRVIYVNPAYSSQICSKCGALGNRHKHRFECSTCGSWQHSDRNACQNLCKFAGSAVSAMARVNVPMVAAQIELATSSRL